MQEETNEYKLRYLIPRLSLEVLDIFYPKELEGLLNGSIDITINRIGSVKSLIGSKINTYIKDGIPWDNELTKTRLMAASRIISDFKSTREIKTNDVEDMSIVEERFPVEKLTFEDINNVDVTKLDNISEYVISLLQDISLNEPTTPVAMKREYLLGMVDTYPVNELISKYPNEFLQLFLGNPEVEVINKMGNNETYTPPTDTRMIHLIRMVTNLTETLNREGSEVRIHDFLVLVDFPNLSSIMNNKDLTTESVVKSSLIDLLGKGALCHLQKYFIALLGMKNKGDIVIDILTVEFGGFLKASDINIDKESLGYYIYINFGDFIIKDNEIMSYDKKVAYFNSKDELYVKNTKGKK